MVTRKNRIGLVVLAALGAAATSASAELIYGVARTGNGSINQLFTFDSATPGTINVLGNITNLGNLQYLEDIDFRPATGELYGLGYTGSVYKIDINTLVATSVGSIMAPGSGFVNAGIDFNPVADRLRVIDGASGMNFAFNQNTGTNTLDSNGVQYVAGDPNVARTPHVGGVAYNNNVAGAATTTLFSLDTGDQQLAQQVVLGTITPPGSGNITTRGNTGVTSYTQQGFDISGTTGNAYAAFRGVGADGTAYFHTINLLTGQAQFVGSVGIDPGLILAGISAAPAGLNGGGGPNGVPLPAAAVVGPIGAAVAMRFSKRWRRGR